MISENDAKDVGIEEYLQLEKRVIHARIKEQPSDFCVKEINMDGIIVEFKETIENIPFNMEKSSNSEPRTKKTKEKLVGSDDASKGIEKPTIDMDENELRSAIGSEKMMEIENVVLGKVDNCTLQASAVVKDRVALQIAIQNCFPAIDIRHQKQDQSQNNEIFDEEATSTLYITRDPLYVKLKDQGMLAENCDRLLQYLRDGASHPNASCGIELIHDDTKEGRTKLHRIISSSSSCFRTKTEVRDISQRIVVYFSPKILNRKRKRQASDQQQIRSPTAKYIRFILRKTNWEHFAALDYLKKELNLPLVSFSVAGIKDKRAITTQSVVIKTDSMPNFVAFNEKMKSQSQSDHDLRIGNLQFVNGPIQLGQSNGNHFTIRLANIMMEKETTDKPILHSVLSDAINFVQEYGFINYFGFQRVGYPRLDSLPLHEIGRMMLAKEFKELVSQLMSPGSLDTNEMKKAKNAYRELSIDEALAHIKGLHTTIEFKLLKGLKRYGGTAYEQAIRMAYPYNRELLSLHAYQSYLFNCMASLRIRLSREALIEGDLWQNPITKEIEVLHQSRVNELNRQWDLLKKEQQSVDVQSIMQCHPLVNVVLPLVGKRILMPQNQVSQVLHELLRTHGTENILNTGSLKGSYRSLIAKPSDMSFEVHSQDTEVKKMMDMKLQFSLPSGSFATMCLREILHNNV